MLSYHEHNEAERTGQVLPRLEAGERIALTSDAGLPGVNDPGARLISAALEASVPVTVLPGPSAVETALVASGLVGERFQFVGYLPRGERARAALWDELARWPHPVVAFESPRRLPASLASLAAAMPERPVAVCRELTKRFEEVIRGTAAEVADRVTEPPKGEITLVLGELEPVSGDEGRRAGRSRRARAGRSGAAAGSRRRLPPDGSGPEQALPRLSVVRFDNSRPPRYLARRVVFKSGNIVHRLLRVAARRAHPRSGSGCVELAGRGRGAQAVRRRGRSVCRRPAPRHRHRRSDGSRRARSGCRGRLLRGAGAAPGALPDDPYRRRLLGDPGSPRIGRPPGRHRGRRGRRRRHDRARAESRNGPSRTSTSASG